MATKRRDEQPPLERLLKPTPGALPPQSLDAEAAVLSACLWWPEGAEQVEKVAAVIGPDHFYSDANQNIFKSILELRDEGVPHDVTHVAQKLHDDGRLQRIGGTPYLAQLADATPASNIDYHVQTLFELWRLRRTIAIGQQFSANGYATTRDDADKLIRDFQVEVEAVALRSGATSRTKHVRDVLGEAYDIVVATQNGAIQGVATGLALVDQLTTGGQAGDLILLAGRPGMGKTSCALSILYNQARAGYLTVFFSLEMPSVQVALRLVSMHASLDLAKLRAGSLNDDELQRFVDAIADLSRMEIYIDDTAGASMAYVRAACRRLKKLATTKGLLLGMPCIDYIQLMGSIGSAQNREQEVAYNSRMGKELGKELGAPVLILSQLNRSVETRADKRPMLSDLRESGALEQDADQIWFLFRPAYYDKSNDPALRGWVEFIVGKQRNGPTGMRKVAFQEKCARFLDLEEGYSGHYDPRDFKKGDFYNHDDDNDWVQDGS
jgi:replicative DNA helicase